MTDAHIIHGHRLERHLNMSGDVVVIGTGAGGGVAAETLAQAGLKVILLEEGGYVTSKDFRMREADAYPTLYWDIATRKTRDRAITILQGRTVGGSTTVNWTTCFRTPPETLKHWTEGYGLNGFTVEELAPWFAKMEKRLNITRWGAMNANNGALHRGAKKLGWHVEAIDRNVKGCINSGYCGVGCPVDAKQSMLVTTIPSALARGATLVAHARVQSLNIQGDRVVGVDAMALNEKGVDPTGVRIRVEAPYVVLAGGSINSPAVLLRSKAPDPYECVGKRTFLHLVNGSGAIMPERIAPFEGAPQSAYSNEFLFRDGVTGRVGYKIEVPPLHPVLTGIMFSQFGSVHADVMAQFPHLHGLIALMRDGFNEASEGGTVSIGEDGHAVLDYPMNDYLWDGVRHAYLSMAECQFAAGATKVMPMHTDAEFYRSWSEAKTNIQALPLKILHAQLMSAHVMGGCAMGENPKSSVVNSLGKHHQLANLWVMDGSIFPTSVGANPSLTIYAMAARQATALAKIREQR